MFVSLAQEDGKKNMFHRHKLTNNWSSATSPCMDSVTDPRCLSRIPHPNFSIPDPASEFFHSGSRIRIFFIPDPGSASKNLSILTLKIFLSSRKYDPGCSSRIRILIFYPSRMQGSKRHWIPDPDPQPTGLKSIWSVAGWCSRCRSPTPSSWSRWSSPSTTLAATSGRSSYSSNFSGEPNRSP